MTQLHDDAIAYVKTHRNELIEKFASIKVYPAVENPEAFFMAGSPGAGKTEYSKAFISALEDKDPKRKIVRIDADEVRDSLPMYNHKNSDEVQGAAVRGVEKILDSVLKNNQEFLLDATFALYDKSYTNIDRCLRDNRKVSIYYIYLDPLNAWDITQKREALEGRRVPKDMFIRAFFNAKENVNKIKKELGKKIQLTVIVKNFKDGKPGIDKIHINVDNIDNYLKIEYNSTSLEEKLHENIQNN